MWKFLLFFYLKLVISQNTSRYTLKNDCNLNLNQNETWLISSLRLNSKFLCFAECEKNFDCLTLVFVQISSTSEENCFLYAKFFTSIETKVAIGYQFYERDCTLVTTFGETICIKQDQSILKAVQTYKKRFTSTSAFSTLQSFGSYSGITEQLYYVIDQNNLIRTFDQDWKLVSSKTNFFHPAFILQIFDDLFLTCDNNVYKTDKDLNVLKTFTNLGVFNRGLVYSKASDRILITNFNYNRILVLDRNLTNSRLISTSTYQPFSIAVFDDKYYLGTTNGLLLIMQNEVITNIQASICGDFIHSIIIDNYGYMAFVCAGSASANVYYKNLTNAGVSIKTTAITTCLNFDFNGRIIITSSTKFDIYY